MGGTLTPGNAGLGTATVLGNYKQGPAGVLEEVLAGTEPGQFGVTDVGGAVTLLAGAALDVSFSSGFTPGLGDSWTIMDFEPGGLTGAFDYTPNSLGNGSFLDIAYNNSAGDIDLYVGDVPPTPEPASFLLFGSGLLGLAICWKRLQRRHTLSNRSGVRRA